jgi:hypothetical protein
VTPEKSTEREEIPSEPGDHTDAKIGSKADSKKEMRSLDVWSRSAPIRLAGYEDDDAIDPHILRGID